MNEITKRWIGKFLDCRVKDIGNLLGPFLGAFMIAFLSFAFTIIYTLNDRCNEINFTRESTFNNLLILLILTLVALVAAKILDELTILQFTIGAISAAVLITIFIVLLYPTIWGIVQYKCAVSTPPQLDPETSDAIDEDTEESLAPPSLPICYGTVISPIDYYSSQDFNTPIIGSLEKNQRIEVLQAYSGNG